MKKYLTISNLFLLLSIIASTVIAIVYSSIFTWIVYFSAIFGILSSKTATDGKWTTFVFDIISYGLYIYLCVTEKYYGELILSCIIIVIHFISLFEWKRHQKNDVVEIRKLNNKELYFSLSLSFVVLIIYALVLFYIKTEFPILNAIPTIVYLLGNYFCYRRSVLQFYCWIGYEIFFGILWILSATNGEIGSLIFLIGGISEFIYGIIGIKNWNKLYLEQQNPKN